MHSVSRRNILRLAGGVAATGGVLGASTLAPAHAAQRKVKARLNSLRRPAGDRLTLHISENLSQARKIRVKDSEGLVWKRRIRKPRYQVWTAKTKEPGHGTVTVVTGVPTARSSATSSTTRSPALRSRAPPWPPVPR